RPTVSPGWVTEPASAELAMPNDSAPAAISFMNLLVIDISLDMEVPWRDCDPLQFHISTMGASALQGASQRVGLNVPTLGPGKAPAACHSRSKRCPLIANADFRRASASP